MTALRLLFLAPLLLLTGCATEMPEDLVSVFMEAPPSAPDSAIGIVALPTSGVQVAVLRIPIVQAEHVLNTEVVEAGERDIRSSYLLLQVDRRAAPLLMAATGKSESVGRKLVLMVNDQAIGLMRVEGPILDGNLFFAVERENLGAAEAAGYWRDRLNPSILLVRKIREKEGK